MDKATGGSGRGTHEGGHLRVGHPVVAVSGEVDRVDDARQQRRHRDDLVDGVGREDGKGRRDLGGEVEVERSQLHEHRAVVVDELVAHELDQLVHHLLVDAVVEARHHRRGHVGHLEDPRRWELVPRSIAERLVSAPELSRLRLRQVEVGAVQRLVLPVLAATVWIRRQDSVVVAERC